MSSTVDADMNYLSDCVIDALVQNNVSRSYPLHQCKSVSVNGLTYRCCMYVITDFDSNSDTPVFGHIDNIFIQQMKVHFLLRICKSNYDSHLSSYELCVADDITVQNVDQLLDCYPLSAYVVGLNRFVVLKNFVYSHSLFKWSVPVLLTMSSKRLLITVADSTKVVTIDGSVDANVLKEVICGISCLFIWLSSYAPRSLYIVRRHIVQYACYQRDSIASYASAGIAIAQMSVTACPSHTGIVSTQRKPGSPFLPRWIVPSPWVSQHSRWESVPQHHVHKEHEGGQWRWSWCDFWTHGVQSWLRDSKLSGYYDSWEPSDVYSTSNDVPSAGELPRGPTWGSPSVCNSSHISFLLPCRHRGDTSHGWWVGVRKEDTNGKEGSWITGVIQARIASCSKIDTTCPSTTCGYYAVAVNDVQPSCHRGYSSTES